MSQEFKDILPKIDQEIERPLPLVTDLFDFAAQNGSPDANNYWQDKAKEIRLPQKLLPLTSGFPEVQYLVGYEDRTDSYYREDTRGKWVLLSDRISKTESNKPLTELAYSQKPRGNYLATFLRVSQFVNEKGFAEWDDQTDRGETVTPHGNTRREYIIDQSGKQQLIEVEVGRVDEAIIEEEGKKKTISWYRTANLFTDKHQEEAEHIEYADHILIGTNKNAPQEENRVSLRFEVEGSLDTPKSIAIRIGSYIGDPGKLLYENTDHHIRITLHAVKGDEVENILKDPANSFLKEDLSSERIISEVINRIRTLCEHWNEPQSVADSTSSLPEHIDTLSEETFLGIQTEMNSIGFIYGGKEPLSTKKEIIAKYTQAFAELAEMEVRIIPDPEDPSQFWVFLRQIER